MRMLRSAPCFLLLAAVCTPVSAQEENFGISVPLTISAGALNTHRLQDEDPRASTVAAAFRAVFYPTLRLGPRWFVYSAIQVGSTPFSYYDAYESDRRMDVRLRQAFLGYTRQAKNRALMVKAGRLISAFGSFPLRYDEADNPLLDQPLPYSSYLPLRADQLPCDVGDLLEQSEYGYGRNVRFWCGGAKTPSDGMAPAPATLYGLPGIEVDLSAHRVDGRLQVTNSSPANPQSLLSQNQHAQWTAGAGYTFHQGFRVGFSAFRGPYLDRVVASLLPAAQSIRDFPASALGMDLQWSRGRWSVNGELQRYQFNYPGFRTSPAVSYGYAEVKAVLNPRIYLASRVGYGRHNRVQDLSEKSSEGFAPNLQAYEFAIGYRPNRWQLVKLGYEWLKMDGVSGTRDNVLGIQLVTSVQSLSKTFR